jgi:cobalt/nickel transport system permease protein
MHISEGILAGPVLAAGAAVAVAGLAIGLRGLENERVPEVAVLASAFFVASLVRVPVGPANLHLVLNGLVGLLLGWSAFPAIVVALVLQALLFQFGGLSTLGVNAAVMGLPAVAAWALARPLARRHPLASGFIAGITGVGLGTLCMAVALVGSDENLLNLARVLMVTHLPLMLAEGVITAFIVRFILKVRPEMLGLNTKVAP